MGVSPPSGGAPVKNEAASRMTAGDRQATQRDKVNPAQKLRASFDVLLLDALRWVSARGCETYISRIESAARVQQHKRRRDGDGSESFRRCARGRCAGASDCRADCDDGVQREAAKPNPTVTCERARLRVRETHINRTAPYWNVQHTYKHTRPQHPTHTQCSAARMEQRSV